MLHAALLFFFALITSCTTEDICLELPITPVNSAIRCRSYRLCEATCRSNYEFPTGEISVSIACFSGTWKLQSTQALSIPDCKPVCNPRCRNEGLCVAHNTCSCKPQYTGAYCENEVQQSYISAQLICNSFPPTPINSRKNCNSRQCTIRCFDNYKFPDGSTTNQINCQNGQWIAENRIWSTIPDCQAVCNPRCRNEGLCVAHNTCSCKPQYTGAYCENEVQQRYTSAQLICNSFPTTPINSRKTCNSRQCTIRCFDNYQFPGGSTTAQINCQNGQWIVENRAWSTIPDCQAVCNPRCRNEGLCVAHNTCSCKPQYAGAYCENEVQQRYTSAQLICNSFPTTPINSRKTCNSRQCTIQCVDNYQFPDGSAAAQINCQNGQWIAENRAWSTIPDCQAVCNPRCQNEGVCILPNTCVCNPRFFGAHCENEAQICSSFPSTPLNSRRSCDSRQCTVQCVENHQLPDGRTTAYITCQAGRWIPDNRAWSTVPDCQPVCNPPCRNGGRCWASNTCQCIGNFKGPQCQYECVGDMPPVPVNSILRCSYTGVCNATCVAEHQFPSGATELRISCGATGWRSDTGLSTFPDCQPICNPPCLNSGICVSPNQCFCRDQIFSGVQCQTQNRLCDSYPRLPANGFRSCNSRRCLMQCTPGFKFPGGLDSFTATCQNGSWRFSNSIWQTVPDCNIPS